MDDASGDISLQPSLHFGTKRFLFSGITGFKVHANPPAPTGEPADIVEVDVAIMP